MGNFRHRHSYLSSCTGNLSASKKAYSDEYLRSIAHLRPRTRKFGAIFRLRSLLSLAIHRFFHERGLYYVHTPILTAADCEGAGELFPVSASEIDFFNRPVHLTVSGQLSAEMLAMGLGKVYTFGPTFRAENSNTRRHASEFWMIEPEAAFYDLTDNMTLAEDFLKELVLVALDQGRADIEYLSQTEEKEIVRELSKLADSSFMRLPYTEAIHILQKSAESFEFEPVWGEDLQSAHEQYLTAHFNCPVIVYDYPKTIKPFYMRLNDKTVRAMDVLVCGVGELIGGSQREERLDVLVARMHEQKLPLAEYEWYLDSRRYGSVPHSGFGVGFERLMMYITDISNIRDVIPFPRTPGSVSFYILFCF